MLIVYNMLPFTRRYDRQTRGGCIGPALRRSRRASLRPLMTGEPWYVGACLCLADGYTLISFVLPDQRADRKGAVHLSARRFAERLLVQARALARTLAATQTVEQRLKEMQLLQQRLEEQNQSLRMSVALHRHVLLHGQHESSGSLAQGFRHLQVHLPPDEGALDAG